MPSSHLKPVDKNWIDGLDNESLDNFLSFFGDVAEKQRELGEFKHSSNRIVHALTLPPLRLRTPRGGELEIDSIFQKQLRVAKLCHLLGLPEVLTDWKFPKTRVLSRPDFSRSSMLPFRLTGTHENKEAQNQDEATFKSSKKGWSSGEEPHELRSDTVPSYVAACLESSPRDPLAAEEASRRAASMLNTVAAPKKVYLPIVNKASVHQKSLHETDIRHPKRAFPHWCFGCRLEHGLPNRGPNSLHDLYFCQNEHCRFARWQGLPVLFGPFKDKALRVRVGGGFAYLNWQDLEADVTKTRAEVDGRKTSNLYRMQSHKPEELPMMSRAGFSPRKPKVQDKEKLYARRLPKIAEVESPADMIDFDPKVLLEGREQPQLADLQDINLDLQLNKMWREQLQPPDNSHCSMKQSVASMTEDLEASSSSGSHGSCGSRGSSGSSDGSSLSTSTVSPDVSLASSDRNKVSDTRQDEQSHSCSEKEEKQPDKKLMKESIGPSWLSPADDSLTSSLQQTVHLTSYAKELPSYTGIDLRPAHISRSTQVSPSNSFSSLPLHSPISISTDSSTPSPTPQSFRLASAASADTAYTNKATQMRLRLEVRPFPENHSVFEVPDETNELHEEQETKDSLAASNHSDVDTLSANKGFSEPKLAYENSPVLSKGEPPLESNSLEAISTTSLQDETEVVHSPLLGARPEWQWVVVPLAVQTHQDTFVSPDFLLPPAQHNLVSTDYSDPILAESETNKVTSTLVVSKEYVPIWTITKEILHDVMEDVIKQIAKKKAPTKKTKRETVRKPVKKVRKVERVENGSSSPVQPVQKSPLPPPPKKSSPVPSSTHDNEGELSPKATTPLKPITSPRLETPPKPVTPPAQQVTISPRLPTPPNSAVQLPPLPEVNYPPKVKPQPKSQMQSQNFGTSLVSRTGSSREATPNSLVSPSQLSPGSPDYEFTIVPRSPSPRAKPLAAKTSGRILDSKVDTEIATDQGTDWTFRQRLTIPAIAEKPTEPAVVEKPLLPDIVEKPPTPEPEPQPDPKPVRRRIRKIPASLTKATKAFRKKSRPMLSKKELKSITDPLDYLAKYCLIHPDRLPVYERIFKEVVAKQSPRFSEVYCVLDKASEEKPLPIRHVEEPGPPYDSLSDEKKRRLRDAASMKDGKDQVAMNTAEYQVSKLTFTLDQLYNKYNQLLDDYEEMEKCKERRVSALAQKLFPHVLENDYVAPTKHKKGKKSKTKDNKTTSLPPIPSAGNTTGRLSDAVIVSRLSSAERKRINLDDEVYRLQLKLNRMEAKVRSAEERMDELEAEKLEMQVWSQELYLKECVQSYQEPEFRQKQSTLFNKFHPDMDEQMNIDEVEEALRTINGHLLTDKELQFIYHILQIPGRKVLNLKTFGCVAALSEKVQQLHPVIRKLINKFDFEALDVKMEKCRELYELLQEGTSDKPDGTIPLRALHVELQAGGLSDEHLDFVTSKFNVTEKGYVEYLDFLTYVPLFVELHDRICSNPLATERVS